MVDNIRDRMYFVVKINGVIVPDMTADGNINHFTTSKEANTRAEEMVMAGKGEFMCGIAEITDIRNYEAKVGRIQLRVPDVVSKESPL